jgi:ATP-dependent Lon protease
LLAKPDTKYLLIDEIDKMKKDQVTVLFNLLETGRLTSTKKNFTFDQTFEGLRVFATSNSLERIPRPLVSRIMTLLIPEYTFAEISRRAIKKKVRT